MVIDWRKQIDECVKNTEIMPIFHGNPVSNRLQLVLITKKLSEMGYDRQKIFNWFMLAGCETVYSIDDVDSLLSTAKKRRWPKKHDFKIFITSEEIEYIDSINATKESKSFLLGVISFAKMMNIKKKKPTFNKTDRSYAYYIATGKDEYWGSKERSRWVGRFFNGLQRSKKISLSTASTLFKIYTGRRGGSIKQVFNSVIAAKWIDWEATDGYCIKTLETDVKRLCDLAFHDQTAICPECGNEFIIGSYTQTDLCPECYEKHRNDCENTRKKKYKLEHPEQPHDKNTTHDPGDRKKPVEIRICAQCGKEFEADGNCKTILCNECQKKHSKELTRLRQQRYRDNKKLELKT